MKFWKKQPTGVEFVKMYRAHLGPVDGEECGEDGVSYGGKRGVHRGHGGCWVCQDGPGAPGAW